MATGEILYVAPGRGTRTKRSPYCLAQAVPVERAEEDQAAGERCLCGDDVTKLCECKPLSGGGPCDCRVRDCDDCCRTFCVDCIDQHRAECPDSAAPPAEEGERCESMSDKGHRCTMTDPHAGTGDEPHKARDGGLIWVGPPHPDPAKQSPDPWEDPVAEAREADQDIDDLWGAAFTSCDPTDQEGAAVKVVEAIVTATRAADRATIAGLEAVVTKYGTDFDTARAHYEETIAERDAEIARLEAKVATEHERGDAHLEAAIAAKEAAEEAEDLARTTKSRKAEAALDTERDERVAASESFSTAIAKCDEEIDAERERADDAVGALEFSRGGWKCPPDCGRVHDASIDRCSWCTTPRPNHPATPEQEGVREGTWTVEDDHAEGWDCSEHGHWPHGQERCPVLVDGVLCGVTRPQTEEGESHG